MEDLKSQRGSMRQEHQVTMILPKPGEGKGMAEYRAQGHQMKARTLRKAQELSEMLPHTERELVVGGGGSPGFPLTKTSQR